VLTCAVIVYVGGFNVGQIGQMAGALYDEVVAAANRAYSMCVTATVTLFLLDIYIRPPEYPSATLVEEECCFHHRFYRATVC